MIEKDILEKRHLALFMRKHISWLPIDYGNNKVYDFARALDTSFLCRLFESGVYLRYNICSYFAPMDEPGWKYINDILMYNDLTVTKTLFYSTGVYIQSLGLCKDKIRNAYTDSHTPQISVEIFKHIPKHKYLSWAFHYASSNGSLMDSFSGKILRLFT